MSVSMISRLTIDQICNRGTDLLMSQEDIQKMVDIAKEHAVKDFLEKIEDRFYSTHPDEQYYTYTPSDIVDICRGIFEQTKGTRKQ